MVCKMISRTTLGLMLIAILAGPVSAQEETQSFRESVEGILSLTDENDPAGLLEELAELKENPVNINSAEIHEISRLFFLTEFQVMVLADHVRRNGSVVSLYELALLPSFDRNTVMMMAPYISLQPSREMKGRTYGRTTVTLTATSRIIPDEVVSGGIRSLLKMKHEHGRLTLGLTAENDPAEPFSFRNGPGTDFFSASVGYRGKGLIERAIAGDYNLRTGEGLVFNSNWIGSWLSSPSFMSGRTAATPYTSAEENSFLRGLCIMLGSINSGALLFASSHKIDARISFSEDSTSSWVSNLVRGGLHVNESQMKARKSLTETVAGLHLTAGADRIRGGLTASATRFSLPFKPDTGRPENLHSFTGDRLLNLAADLRAGTGPVLFFGEAGMSLPGSWASIAGLRAKASDRVTFNLLARHFSPGYHAFHSGAFKAGSGSGNETGLSASLHLEAASHLYLTAAADHYRIPWLRYRSCSPSYGNRIEIKAEYNPRDDISARLSYTSSSREYDSAAETGTAVSVTHNRQQLAFILDCNPARGLRFAVRASASAITPSGEKGYLLCNDIAYSHPGGSLRFWFRHALCSTGGWDSRLYAWENDLLSSFSVPALYGEMTRSFLMISWKPAERAEVRLKYAVTEAGSDSGSRLKHELKGQVRIMF